MTKADIRTEVVQVIRDKCFPASSMIVHVLKGEHLTDKERSALQTASKAIDQMLAYADKLSAELRSARNND